MRGSELSKIPLARHCEERSDVAIHDFQWHGLPRFARNDEKCTFEISISLRGNDG